MGLAPSTLDSTERLLGRGGLLGGGRRGLVPLVLSEGFEDIVLLLCLPTNLDNPLKNTIKYINLCLFV